MPERRFVIIGAGAVGGALAAQLVPAGFDVVLVARGEHGKRIAADGLRVLRPSGPEVIEVTVVTDLDSLRLSLTDVLLLAVKTQDAEAALAVWAWQPVHDEVGDVVGAAATHLPIVTFQNGLATEDLALRRFHHVFGATIAVAASYTEPGEIVSPSLDPAAVVWLGRYPDRADPLAEEIAADLVRAGIATYAVPDISAQKAAKLLANLSMNGLALLDGTDEERSEAQRLLREEAVAVLRAAGTPLPPGNELDHRDAGFRVQDVPGYTPRGSTWQSFVRGASSEIDFLNGEIVLLAHRAGVPAPLNRRLQELLGSPLLADQRTFGALLASTRRAPITADTAQPSAAAAAPPKGDATAWRPKTRLGFNTRVSFNDTDGAAAGLRDGIRLYQAAEGLGYQSGWSYQRHFDHYLSSPLPFFAAVGQLTTRITIGSAVIPMRYQEPILLAEAAAVTDLLIGERLELAIATGENATFDSVFGASKTDARTEAKSRQRRFLDAIAGQVLHIVDGPGQGAPEGTELRVTPHSPTLSSRIRQGSSSLGSAMQAAELGIGLITGTVLHGHPEDEPFGHYQARIIEAYRARWRERWASEPPPVAVAASILPSTTAALRTTYAAYDLERRTQGIGASRPTGALAPVGAGAEPLGNQICPVYHGEPDDVIAGVLANPGLAAADELVLFLPPSFTLAQNIRLLDDLASTVAPALGWSPAS